MLSDDVYRAQLEATIAALRYWVPQIADVARIEETDAPEYWKLTVTPHVANACPFELMLRADQKHDLMIASEAFEDRDTKDLNLFLPLVEAIASGNVVQRLTSSQMTGVLQAIETLVLMPKARTWRETRTIDGGMPLPEGDAGEIQIKHFLAYRR